MITLCSTTMASVFHRHVKDHIILMVRSAKLVTIIALPARMASNLAVYHAETPDFFRAQPALLLAMQLAIMAMS